MTSGLLPCAVSSSSGGSRLNFNTYNFNNIVLSSINYVLKEGFTRTGVTHLNNEHLLRVTQIKNETDNFAPIEWHFFKRRRVIVGQ